MSDFLDLVTPHAEVCTCVQKYDSDQTMFPLRRVPPSGEAVVIKKTCPYLAYVDGLHLMAPKSHKSQLLLCPVTTGTN